MELLLEAILAEVVAVLAHLALVRLLDWWRGRAAAAEELALAV